MPTSDEDLQKEMDRVQKLREQVADAEAKRVSRERELANDVTMNQLQAEAAQLEARLTVQSDSSKVANVKSGAAAPIEATKEELKRAVAMRDAAKKAGENAARETESTDAGTASADSASAAADAATDK